MKYCNRARSFAAHESTNWHYIASQLVDEIASDVLPPQTVAIVLTELSGSRLPVLAGAPSE
jgi:hypothetical protein